MSDSHSLDKHISTRYNTELEDIRAKALAMGVVVEEQLADSLRAIANSDGELARKIIARDKEVNEMELMIDGSCIRVIAQRQPAASDLRLIIAITRMITDLERIGDEARRIAVTAKHLAQSGESTEQYHELRQLGEHVRKALNQALDAFARADVDAAVRVLHEDKQVDQEYENVLRHTINFMMEQREAIPSALDLVWSARALERIADRACNIAEYAIYFVKGEDVRHTPLDDLDSL